VILDAIRKRLDDAGKKIVEVSAPPPLPSIDQLNLLKTLDLGQKIAKKIIRMSWKNIRASSRC